MQSMRQAVPFDHDARLAGGDEFGVVAALLQAVGDFDRDDHLADRAIVPDRVHAQAIGSQALAASDRLFGVFANVVNRDAALLRPRRRTPDRRRRNRADR